MTHRKNYKLNFLTQITPQNAHFISNDLFFPMLFLFAALLLDKLLLLGLCGPGTRELEQLLHTNGKKVDSTNAGCIVHDYDFVRDDGKRFGVEH